MKPTLRRATYVAIDPKQMSEFLFAPSRGKGATMLDMEKAIENYLIHRKGLVLEAPADFQEHASRMTVLQWLNESLNEGLSVSIEGEVMKHTIAGQGEEATSPGGPALSFKREEETTPGGGALRLRQGERVSISGETKARVFSKEEMAAAKEHLLGAVGRSRGVLRYPDESIAEYKARVARKAHYQPAAPGSVATPAAPGKLPSGDHEGWALLISASQHPEQYPARDADETDAAWVERVRGLQG